MLITLKDWETLVPGAGVQTAKMEERSVVAAWMILEPSSPLPSVLPPCSLAWPSSSASSVLSPLSFSSCAGTSP